MSKVYIVEAHHTAEGTEICGVFIEEPTIEDAIILAKNETIYDAKEFEEWIAVDVNEYDLKESVTTACACNYCIVSAREQKITNREYGTISTKKHDDVRELLPFRRFTVTDSLHRKGQGAYSPNHPDGLCYVIDWEYGAHCSYSQNNVEQLMEIEWIDGA